MGRRGARRPTGEGRQWAAWDLISTPRGAAGLWHPRLTPCGCPASARSFNNATAPAVRTDTHITSPIKSIITPPRGGRRASPLPGLNNTTNLVGAKRDKRRRARRPRVPSAEKKQRATRLSIGSCSGVENRRRGRRGWACRGSASGCFRDDNTRSGDTRVPYALANETAGRCSTHNNLRPAIGRRAEFWEGAPCWLPGPANAGYIGSLSAPGPRASSRAKRAQLHIMFTAAGTWITCCPQQAS